MAGDRDIAELLSEEGFVGAAAQRAARAALEHEGLTRPGKRRISDAKANPVRELLLRLFARACRSPTCQAALSREKPAASLLVVESPARCENCGGSDNRRSMLSLAEECRRLRITKMVVVGGSPSVREELISLKPEGFELRLVDGTERRTQEKARADLDWGELVLVWGSSELDHRVSQLYTEAPPGLRRKVVVAARRGVAALLTAGTAHLARQR